MQENIKKILCINITFDKWSSALHGMKNEIWNKSFTIGGHLLFWIIICIIHYILAAIGDWTQYYLIFMSYLMPFDIIAVYFTAYYLLPNFLLQKKFWRFFAYLAISMVVIVLGQRFVVYYFIYPQLEDAEEFLKHPFLYLPYFWRAWVNTYTFAFLFSGIRLYSSWLKEQKHQQELEKQGLQSEMALLRSQINPHFLFNTLNNIDLLVFKDQQRASDSIVRLSEIMRYMLYESNADQVLLKKEIQYIESMVDLMRLRLVDPDFIQFQIQGKSKECMIPPMLLVPFVENAFKHGQKTGQAPGIVIKLQIRDDEYHFMVRNRIQEGFNTSKDSTGGIGLSNVKRRLALLYSDNHRLDIQKEAHRFEIHLQIPSEIKSKPIVTLNK